MQSRRSNGREAMRVSKVLFAVAVVAAVLVGAQAALALDPIPAKTCTTTNGWSVSTLGLVYVEVMNTTMITYNITPLAGSTPDHVGTFVRKEAGVPTPSGSYNISTLCGGDSTFGIGSGAICHERIVRFNNQQTKGSEFTLTVAGRRRPIETSVIVKKGNSQGACAIEGFGLEDTTSGLCVHQCGNFDEHQSIVKTEIFKFKGCEVRFDFDTTTGVVLDFQVVSGPCTATVGSVGDLTISGPGIDADSQLISFGDGWVGSGNDSCTTRLVSGKYYTVCY